MNVDELTCGQIKELSSLFNNNNQSPKKQPSILSDSIGRYVIVRTKNEGINCGKVIKADDTGVVIEDARRLYYHKPKDENVSWYEGVAETGLSSDSKISGVVSLKYIIEDYSLTVCSKEAEENLRNYEATKS